MPWWRWRSCIRWKTVNKLDYDIRFADTADTDQHTWSTELRPPRDDLDRAADLLLAGLVDRLSLLDPLACVRWIGELLTAGPAVLHSHRGGEKPLRANQLESACTKLLATLVRGSLSSEMLAALRAGLSVHAQPTWTRHLAELAWAVRATVPERAADIAQTTLKEHRLHVDVELERNQLFLDWGRWDHREWIRGLGSSLALSDGELDVTTWGHGAVPRIAPDRMGCRCRRESPVFPRRRPGGTTLVPRGISRHRSVGGSW